jgi:hypothetical protein
MAWNLRELGIFIYLTISALVLIVFTLKAVGVTMDSIEEIVSLIKDVANIAFFVGVPTIAFWAYKQARETVFSPQKNEVFKMQLTAIDALSKLCHITSWDDLMNKIHISAISEATNRTIYSMMHEEFLGGSTKYEYFSFNDDGVWIKSDEKNDEYDLTFICLPVEHTSFMNSLKAFEYSVFITDDICSDVRKFRENIESLYPLIGDGIRGLMKNIKKKQAGGREKGEDICKFLNYGGRSKLLNSDELKNTLKSAEKLNMNIKRYAKTNHLLE